MGEELDRQELSLDRINLKAGIAGGKLLHRRLGDSPSPPPSLQVAVTDVSMHR